MRLRSNRPLSEFLQGLPNPARLSRSFSSAPLVYSYSGPHRFFRAFRQGLSFESQGEIGGAFWGEEKVLTQIALELERSIDWHHPLKAAHAWPVYLRALTSLSTDWDNNCRILALHLPAGAQIEALLGLPYQSPEFFAEEPNGQPILYSGKVEQIFIKSPPDSWVSEVPLW
jgi:hypothetical protein